MRMEASVVRVAYPACSAVLLLFALVLQLAACGRTAPDGAPGKVSASPGLASALSNPWSGSAPVPASAPADSNPSSTTSSLPQAPRLDSQDPHARQLALETWARTRPDSLHEIRRLLDDPDLSVRTYARAAWKAALSGGREADPE